MDYVESVHYLFNRYAFLGVAEDASADEIRAALKQRRVENHPDRLTKAGTEVKNVAANVLDKLLLCEEVLLDPELRAAFDARLAYFRAERPRVISVDGSVIIDLDEKTPLYDVGTWLSGQMPDMSTMEAHAAALAQYNPAHTAKLRKLVAFDPDDAELRGMLVETLHRELAYLDIVEDYGWEMAGVHHPLKTARLLGDAEEYAEEVETRIAHVLEKEVPAQLESVFTAARLGMSVPPLLLVAPDTVAAGQEPLTRQQLSTLEVAHKAQLVEKARAMFAARADMLRERALRKQAVMAELATLAPTTWLMPLPPTPGDFSIYLLAQGRVAMVFSAHDTDRRVRGPEDSDCLGLTLEELGACSFPHDAVAVELDTELVGLRQPLVVIAPLFDKRLALFEQENLPDATEKQLSA